MKCIGIMLSICLVMIGCGTGNEKLPLIDQGELAFSQRDYLEAVRIWNMELKKSPDNPMLMKKLGRGYLKLGRLERAKVLFEGAIKAAPDDIEVAGHLARLYLLTFDFPKAEQLVENFIAKGVTSPELSILKADICVLKQQNSEAEQFYRKAVIESKDALRALLKLAIFLRSEQRETEASEIFEIVAKRNVRNPQVYLLMADYHKIGNDFQRAEENIESAIALEPEQLELKYHLFLFYLETGRTLKAENILNAMLAVQDDIHLRMLLADIRLTQGRIEEAGRIVAQIKDMVGDKVAVFELLQGKYWLYAGKPAFAAAYFKTAVGLKPGLANTRYFLGLTHLANNKVKLSENSLLLALQVDPGHERALLLIAQIYYKKKEYRLSLDYVSKMLDLNPSHFSGVILKGLNYMEMGLLEDAKTVFEQSVLLSGKDTHTSEYYLGLVEEKLGNFETALAHYRRIIEKKTNLIDVSYRYGRTLIKLKKHAKARDFISRNIEKQELPADFYYMLARLSALMKDEAQQELLLIKGIEQNERLGMLYLELSRLYRGKKQFTRSLKVLNDCIEKNPGYENAWIELGAAYLDRRNSAMAQEMLEKGYERFKGSAKYISNLAWVYLENEIQINKALNLAQAAYDMSPGDIAIVDTLAWAYYHKGIYSQAHWLLNEAFRKEPDNPLIKYHLGMTRYMQGRFEQAEEVLQTVKDEPVLAACQSLIEATLEKMKRNETADQAGENIKMDDLISDPKIDDTDSELNLQDLSIE